MQTKLLRNILNATSCCHGNCSKNTEPAEIFFPDIMADQLKRLVEFLHTGRLAHATNILNEYQRFLFLFAPVAE